MWQHITHPLSLLVILNGLCHIASRQITDVEILQKTTCKEVYEKALDSRGELNFSTAIGNLTCKPDPNGFVRYHCMTNEDGHDIQFCTEWIWIEPDLCPRLYSVQSIINPEKCEMNECPKDRYQSHMYYNFSVCFNKVSDEKGSKETQEGNSSGVNLGLAVALPVCFVAVIAIIIAVFVIRKQRKDGRKYTTDAEQQRLLNESVSGATTAKIMSQTVSPLEPHLSERSLSFGEI